MKKLEAQIRAWMADIENYEIAEIDNIERITMVYYLIVSLAVCFLGIKVLGLFMDPVNRQYTSRWVEISNIIQIFLFTKFAPFKMRRMGLKATKEELKGALMRGGRISLGIAVGIVIVRLVLTCFDPSISGRPWFKPDFLYQTRWLYLLVVIIQEFLSKGLLQEKFKELFGPGHLHLSIWACGISFFMFHFGYPLYFMAGAALLSVVTGYIYEKDRCIWGCVLIHFCLGFLPRAMGLG